MTHWSSDRTIKDSLDRIAGMVADAWPSEFDSSNRASTLRPHLQVIRRYHRYANQALRWCGAAAAGRTKPDGASVRRYLPDVHSSVDIASLVFKSSITVLEKAEFATLLTIARIRYQVDLSNKAVSSLQEIQAVAARLVEYIGDSMPSDHKERLITIERLAGAYREPLLPMPGNQAVADYYDAIRAWHADLPDIHEAVEMVLRGEDFAPLYPPKPETA